MGGGICGEVETGAPAGDCGAVKGNGGCRTPGVFGCDVGAGIVGCAGAGVCGGTTGGAGGCAGAGVCGWASGGIIGVGCVAAGGG